MMTWDELLYFLEPYGMNPMTKVIMGLIWELNFLKVQPIDWCQDMDHACYNEL